MASIQYIRFHDEEQLLHIPEITQLKFNIIRNWSCSLITAKVNMQLDIL